jgi:SAM-dependent methyltransferase
MANIDQKTVAGFGDEWARFDQRALSDTEREALFNRYFRIFPFSSLPAGAVGFDLGCGSGRWASLVAPKVGRLHCVDASDEALGVAKRNLSALPNCEFHHASVDAIPLAESSMDFGYSLGVLHHVPDTAAGIAACVKRLKPGAPFLLYLYYRFDNRPPWFRALWQLSDIGRRSISSLPHDRRQQVTDLIAAGVYLPLARSSKVLSALGIDVSTVPLSAYRDASFYTMRTDALDRFGTRLEQRFTRDEMRTMMERAGLERITFSEDVPYWCAVGYRK